MPFIGRDWRSPGEAWVKTESLGWQRMKIIESQLHPGCHQHHAPTCSWPPPGYAGQHMANNCASLDARSGSKHNNKIDSVERNTEQMNVEIRDELSSGDHSACSSENTSASSSPDSSLEKNGVVHHLHPITISSPYGRHSCCGYYLQQRLNEVIPGRSSSPRPNICCYDHAHANHRQMIRSLSRDSFESSPPATTSTSCSSSFQRMRYNNNYPNSRNSQDSRARSSVDDDLVTKRDIDINENDLKTEIKKTASNMSSPIGNQNNHINIQTPVIMKDGVKLVCDRNSGSNSQENPEKSFDEANDSSRSVSPHACCCCCQQQSSNNTTHYQEQTKTAPHCRVSVRTREVAMHNTISEAFYRLDFYNAIHDIRRFNYICKLLHLLITQNLTSLSGCATKVLFTMLEQVAWEVSSNKRNIHIIRNLLEELNQTIQKYYCWGRPIGSSMLWQQHFDTIERISRIVDEIELSQTNENENEMTFDKLPIEMIREVLLRLNDYRDLVNSAQASPVMRNMIDEQYIWQKLCRYHFSDQQLKVVFENGSYLNRVKRSTLRGIKYARTAVSADGKISYRNPVARKRLVGCNPVGFDSARSCDPKYRQQKDGLSSISSDSDSSPSESNSHVIKTIRIFDKEGTSATLSSDNRASRTSSFRQDSSSTNRTSSLSGNCMRSNKVTGGKCDGQGEHAAPRDTNQSGNDIDWELVFHHLRKKFDLKEEYADCLLLCRHCRCLFWKSIGHPCMRGDDLQNKHCGPSSRVEQQAWVRPAFDVSQRPSVASLSRSFDNRARMDDLENQQPSSTHRARRDSAILHHGRAGNGARLPLALRNNLQDTAQRRRMNESDRNAANQSQAKPQSREELIPKHITITPQAFLKFFSL